MTLHYICVDSSFIIRLTTAHLSTKIYNQLWRQLLQSWQATQDRIQAQPEQPWTIAIVGGGAGGC